MKATVVTTFRDAVSKKVFRVGDEFPLENVEQERIDLLTKPHPKTNKIYLYVEAQQEQQQKQEQQQEPPQEAQLEPTADDTPPVEEEVKPKATTRRKAKQEPSNEGE